MRQVYRRRNGERRFTLPQLNEEYIQEAINIYFFFFFFVVVKKRTHNVQQQARERIKIKHEEIYKI